MPDYAIGNKEIQLLIGNENLFIGKLSGAFKAVPVFRWRAADVLLKRPKEVRVIPVTGSFHNFNHRKMCFP
jgi:hypothetical protein